MRRFSGAGSPGCLCSTGTGSCYRGSGWEDEHGFYFDLKRRCFLLSRDTLWANSNFTKCEPNMSIPGMPHHATQQDERGGLVQCGVAPRVPSMSRHPPAGTATEDWAAWAITDDSKRRARNGSGMDKGAMGCLVWGIGDGVATSLGSEFVDKMERTGSLSFDATIRWLF